MILILKPTTYNLTPLLTFGWAFLHFAQATSCLVYIKLIIL